MRKRVDWDEEIRKTEQIKRKGLLMSLVSFAVAAAFILGIGKFSENSIEIPKTVLFAGLFCVSCFVFRAIVRKRNSRKNRTND